MAIELLPADSKINATSTCHTALNIVHFNFPWAILIVFVVAFVTNGILTAEPSTESKEPQLTGPGGKPLPRSTKKKKQEEERVKRQLQDFSHSRKLVFYYLSAVVLATFVASGVNVVVHALAESENGWWCGKSTAVSGK